jgi:arylsulfatase A-like enzyme
MVSLVSAALACGGDDERPPNLLLVTVDSLRADFLACYGGDPTVGVRMCALADNGTRYPWAFSPSSRSAPAITSILTSLYPSGPSGHRVEDSAASFLGGDATTLPELLRAAGYRTAAFVSSPELNRSRNLQQGFDHYDDRTRRDSPASLPRRSAEEVTGAALDWIRGGEEPWFVWVHYREPHGPYHSPAPPEQIPYDPDGPGERLRVLPSKTGRGGIPGYQAIAGLFTRQGYEARYRAEIRTVDGQLARLLAEIPSKPEDLGVLITADHGEAFGEDRWYLSHGHSVGLEQIRVPLIWRPAGGTPPEEMQVVVSTLDVAPTLLRAAGVATPETFEGWPLPSADDPPGAPQQARAVFAEHPEHVAIVSGDNYYARLRAPAVDTGSELDAGFLRAVAARTANLDRRRDALPPYEQARPSGITPLLEPRLAEFLARDEDPTPQETPPEAGEEAPETAAEEPANPGPL